MSENDSDTYDDEEVDQSYVYIETLQKQLDQALEETEKDAQRLYNFQSFMEQHDIRTTKNPKKNVVYQNESDLKLIPFNIPVSPYIYVLNE